MLQRFNEEFSHLLTFNLLQFEKIKNKFVKSHYENSQRIWPHFKPYPPNSYIIICSWTLWQNGLSSFQEMDTKLDVFLSKNQHIQRKLLYFVNRHSTEQSKNGHHFRKKVFQKKILIKKIPRLILLNKNHSQKLSDGS